MPPPPRPPTPSCARARGETVMTQVGHPAPRFALPCTDPSGKEWQARAEDYAGRWLIVLFYPRDFSFVCPTELTAFSDRVDEFARRNRRLLGVSSDPVE